MATASTTPISTNPLGVTGTNGPIQSFPTSTASQNINPPAPVATTAAPTGTTAPITAPAINTTTAPVTATAAAPGGTSAPVTTPVNQPSPTGVSDTDFLGLMNNLNNSFQQTNTLIDQKNALLHASMGNPVDPATLAKLPPDVQSVIAGGNQDAMRLYAQSLNDTVNNNNNSVASSISFLTQGYENSITTANNQKQAELTNLMNLASTFVDPKTGTIDIKKVGDVFQALYPGVDMTGVLNDLQGLMPVSEFNKGLQFGLATPSTTSDPTSTQSTLATAISGQESGGSYTAVNPTSGALGKYQIMPTNLTYIGLTDSPADQQKFLASPQLQDQLYQTLMSNLSTKYSGNQSQMIAAYYGGDAAAQVVGTPAGDLPQANGEPSINSYVQSVESKMVDPTVQSYVDGIKNGTVTSIASVPAKYKNLVSVAMDNQNVASPLGDQRWTNTSNKLIANYIALPEYTLTANALPYILKIDAAMGQTGSVSDQDLLDSYTKLSTAGGVLTDAQIAVITKGASITDTADVLYKKFAAQGGVLSDAQRQEIYSLGNAVYKNLQAGYQPIYQAATAKLANSGVPQQFWTLPDLNSLSNLSTDAVQGTGNSTDSSTGNTDTTDSTDTTDNSSNSASSTDPTSMFNNLFTKYGGQ